MSKKNGAKVINPALARLDGIIDATKALAEQAKADRLRGREERASKSGEELRSDADRRD